MMINSKNKKILVIIFAILTISGFCYAVFMGIQEHKESHVVVPPAGDITIRGLIVCLPHKNTNGPQTLECATGLRDAEERYYGVRDTDPGYKNLSNAPMNVIVEVKGKFTPQEDNIYQSIGVIEVVSISEI